MVTFSRVNHCSSTCCHQARPCRHPIIHYHVTNAFNAAWQRQPMNPQYCRTPRAVWDPGLGEKPSSSPNTWGPKYQYITLGIWFPVWQRFGPIWNSHLLHCNVHPKKSFNKSYWKKHPVYSCYLIRINNSASTVASLFFFISSRIQKIVEQLQALHNSWKDVFLYQKDVNIKF